MHIVSGVLAGVVVVALVGFGLPAPDTARAAAVAESQAGGSAVSRHTSSGKAPGLRQAIADAVSNYPELAEFYEDRGFRPLWVAAGDLATRRLGALLEALETGSIHGLPAAIHSADTLRGMVTEARSPTDHAAVEIALAQSFVRHARHLKAGVLTPANMDPEIARTPRRPEARTLLGDIASTRQPRLYMHRLAPQTRQYRALVREKARLEARLTRFGALGLPLRGSRAFSDGKPLYFLGPGHSGERVVRLRNRLVAMGFHPGSASALYDAAMAKAVRRAQRHFGLVVDGLAGPLTLAALDRPDDERLRAVLAALERERWLNALGGLGARHVWVNIPDFSAQIIENDKVVFDTITVVGMNRRRTRTPEFSDEMEFLVINPTWYVPRSIATREYLPLLKEDPQALEHLILTDPQGVPVDRGAVDFRQLSRNNFPFNMREPPHQGNALGLVKFMLPNRHNIYLHDTPLKDLFAHRRRTFSHGCIRLQDPFEFARQLLRAQNDAPETLLDMHLEEGDEHRINLRRRIPVHIVYRTAFADSRGNIQYRDDVYGRDQRIWQALVAYGMAHGVTSG